MGATAQHVSATDAIESALWCLDRRAAIASVDSALHLRVISATELARLRKVLPESRGRMLDLVEAKSESGLESIVRVLLTDLGLDVRAQVKYPGLARVDLLVEGWIVVETDGDAFHGEKVTTRDRRRDAGLTSRGLTVLHFRYAQVIYELESVAVAIVAAVATHRRIHNSGRLVARARSRLRRARFS